MGTPNHLRNLQAEPGAGGRVGGVVRSRLQAQEPRGEPAGGPRLWQLQCGAAEGGGVVDS